MSKSKSKSKSGWRRLTAGGRVWRPEQTNAEHVLVGVIQARAEPKTKFGKRMVWDLSLTADTDDSEGPLGAGEIVRVWESAGLKVLRDVPDGETVRITPDGFGKAKKGQSKPRRYVVEVAE